MPGGSSGYGSGGGGKAGCPDPRLDARGGGKRNPPGIPVPEFRGGNAVRPAGRGDPGDRGTPPGLVRRLGVLHSAVPDPRNPGFARKRFHHGGEGQPPLNCPPEPSPTAHGVSPVTERMLRPIVSIA